MSPLPSEDSTYESIRASILAAYVRDARKAMVAKMGAFTLLFAAVQPLEAWRPPHLDGTLVTIGAAFLAQYLIYRGVFRVVANWVLEHYPSHRGASATWVILGIFLLAVVSSIRMLYELACWLGR